MIKILLSFLISTQLLAQSDLLSSLDSSLKILDSLPLGPELSCFDYQPLPFDIKETVAQQKCSKPFSPLPVGYHMEMKREARSSGNYILSRVGDKSYQAIIHTQFVNRNSKDQGSGTNDLAARIYKRARNCMKELTPYLRGPSGETLEVLLIDKKSPLPKGMRRPIPYVVKVTNQGEGYRGDMLNFGSNFDCKTIGHEVLHMLGLCDEYYEGIIKGTDGLKFDWSCRPVTASNSYMRNINFAFNSIVPQTARCQCDENCQKIMGDSKAREIYLSMNGVDVISTESSLILPFENRALCSSASSPESLPRDFTPPKAFVFEGVKNNTYTFTSYSPNADQYGIFYSKIIHTCTCPVGHRYCQKMMSEIQKVVLNTPRRPGCPKNAPSKSRAPSIGSDASGTRLDCGNADAKKTCDLVIVTQNDGKSLLTPTQFNRIMGGHCEGSSPAYEMCEKYSKMSAKSFQCKEMPPQCLDDQFLLEGKESFNK